MCERALSRTTKGELLARNDYQKVRADISAVKAAMPKVLHDVAARALQVHGSLGVSEEVPFSQMVLESFHIGLADGPTEVHKVALACEILKGYRPTDERFPNRHIPRLRAEAETRYADALARHGCPSKR
jgi:acyl-CoA dehydrogenase